MDENNKPYSPPPITPDQPPVGSPYPDVGTRASHVTNAPQNIPGQAYDPQLRTQYANEPGVTHATRAHEPAQLEISEQTKQLHEESVKRYPHLNLSEAEVVILDIKRHPIGLLPPILATGIIFLAIIIGLILYPASSSTAMTGIPSFGTIVIPALLLMVLIGLGGFIAIWVYLQNQFYMTNESVIQEIQHSLFSRHEQTVSLGSIEDASFTQHGIFQMMFNYGSIRLSTEGEETTYRFSFVTNPRKQVATLNNAIESFKNGRPVDMYEN